MWERWTAVGALVASVALGAPALSAATGEDEVLVPGGVEAVARWLGNTRTEPPRFLDSVNRQLLQEIDRSGKWDLVERRLDLMRYVDEIERLKKRFGRRIEIATEPKPARKRFDDLAESLGFKVQFKKGAFVLTSREGEDEARRRRLANALGWDLSAIGRGLTKKPTILELPEATVPSPVPFREWSGWTGRPVSTATAFEALVKDQAFGLLLEGRRHQTEETRVAFERAGLFRWVYQDAAMPYYRYAETLEIRDGQLILPGGAGAAALWQRLTGESPRNPREFLPALLRRRDGRVAFLWQSLFEVPPSVALYYLGEEGSSDEVRAVRRVLGKLDDSAQESFEAPYGGDLGFGTFVRSIPLDAAGKSLDLPGGAGLWWTAMRGEEAPDDPSRLQRIVEKGRSVRLDDTELLLKALNETVNLSGFDQPALPRLIGVARRFGDRRDLLTPSNVVLLTRAADSYPAALRVLASVAWTEPDVIRDYLLAVAAVDRLPRSANSELLLLSFQGGSELVRRLGGAGRVAPAVLEDHLERWSRLHSRVENPFQAAGEQLGWLERLLTSLPTAGDDAPGRGPLERALLQALAPTRDPQRFEVDGVGFIGERGLESRRVMARRLVEQGVPSYDDLVSLGRTLKSLRAACVAENLEATKASAREAEAILKRFPAVDAKAAKAAGEEQETLERVFPVDRPKVLAVLRELLEVKKANRLSGRTDDVDRVISWMARDLRVALVAPSYLTIMARSESPVFESPNLIRSHRLWEGFKLETVTDSAWQGTRIEAGKAGGLGSSVRGALSGTAAALAEYADIGGASEGAGSFQDLNRIRLAFTEWLSADWEAITPEVSAGVARLIEAGEAELRRDPKSAVVRSVVPGWRLEQALRPDAAVSDEISWSERLAIGLGVGGRPIDPRLLVAGISSLRVNGQGQPWLGRWPSYELLAHERRTTALEERGLADFKLAVVRYLGRRGLDGVIGADLMAAVVSDMRSAKVEGPRDWESWVRFASGFGDEKFDAALRSALERGLYSLE